MDVGLLIAGLLCVGMAIGHAAIGLVWVLPRIDKERLPRTPFGPQSMTFGMLRVTWHVVTVFVLAIGILLITLAADADVDPRTMLLRCLAAMWLLAAAMALWVVRRNLRHFPRLPVPLIWIVVAVLLWQAAA